MLKSLWLRLSASVGDAVDEQALARGYRDEGLRAELETLRARRKYSQSGHERIAHAARSHLAA